MSSKVKVGILMGSDSDLPVMSQAAETLKGLGIPYRMVVASAHRSPDWVREFVSNCEADGAEVFIAGAGGAAHLAGFVAAHTVKPVIGVPLLSKLDGLDSLLSTAQMPKGVPVACVAVDGGANAAILAAQSLAISDAGLRSKLLDERKRMAQEVRRKSDSIQGARS